MVERRLTVPAAPHHVWPEVLDGAWLGDEAHLPTTPGADGWVRDGGLGRSVVVGEVVDGQRFRFGWWQDDTEGVCVASRVTISLDDDVDAMGTRIAVTETRLAPATPLPQGPVAMALW